VLIAGGRGEDYGATLTGDGRWVLYGNRPYGPESAFLAASDYRRVPLEGGMPETVLETGDAGHWIQCGSMPGARCVIIENSNGKVRISSIDPEGGEVTLLQTVDSIVTWGYDTCILSPDGRWIARKDGTFAMSPLVLLDLETGRETILRDSTGKVVELRGFGWSSEAMAIFGYVHEEDSTRFVRVSLDGFVEDISLTPDFSVYMVDFVFSPGDEMIAFNVGYTESNVWVVEGF
jgi:hypothetical protein